MKKVSFKKLVSIFLGLMVCVIMTLPVVAADSKPAVEVMRIETDMNSVGGVSVTLRYRNNSGRQIKYIEWHATAYNRVGDPVPDEIRGKSSVILRVTGPVEPESSHSNIEPRGQTYKNSKYDGTPFSEHRYTNFSINCGGDGDDWSFVYLDKYGNLYAEESYDLNGYVYLTEDEINNAMYDGELSFFKNAFYNHTIDHIQIDYADVTYMDNTTQRVDNVMSKYYNYDLKNEPFMPTVERYSAVYNYNDYKTLNPDLITALGDNEKLLFEHFVNNGMKEGRQGSTEFNLAAYKANNPDLVAAFGDDNVKYYEHYISSGKAEGRKAA